MGRGAESIDVFQQRLKAYAAKNTKQRVRALLCWRRIQRADVSVHVRMDMYCMCTWRSGSSAEVGSRV